MPPGRSRGDPEPRSSRPRTAASPTSPSRACASCSARGRTLGVLTLMTRSPGRLYGADDLPPRRTSPDDGARHRQRPSHATSRSPPTARVLTYVADGVVLVDQTGLIRFWNPAAEAITGLTQDEVIGRAAGDAIAGWKALADRIPVGNGRVRAARDLPVRDRAASAGSPSRESTSSAASSTPSATSPTRAGSRTAGLRRHRLPRAAHAAGRRLRRRATLRRHDFALDEAGRNRFVSLIVDESERLNRIVNEILLANQLDAGRPRSRGGALRRERPHPPGGRVRA